ncbi:MAG TPA: signal recognition particle-docking protein FtsY [Candidatus Eremiobacteraeota bacterium]|nr:MAG: Signal recognition particle receptor FtsY [bacterium ADurb.Bin363]HPZ07445.1 signal recognition particle-docking protein FtsY [Candidatus Eremiobacteraeota bacterium]
MFKFFKGDNWFTKIKDGLLKTRENLTARVKSLFSMRKKIDEELWEELEEVLICSDMGVHTSNMIIEDLKKKARELKIKEPEQLVEHLKERIKECFSNRELGLFTAENKPTIYLMVGVNGSGKTTTIGKLARRLKNSGNKVIIAAGDTFRAAAIEQLDVWAQRVGVEIIKNKQGSDPASVCFDAIQASKARGADYLIIDTAGRLQTKYNLMNELKKIGKIISREVSDAPHETLLVLDATTGQNSLSQAKLFNDTVSLTGIVLTKLDGTAKGGMIVAIENELGVPVKLVGVGETMEDLQDFDPQAFTDALFSA